MRPEGPILAGKDIHILEILVRNPDGLRAPTIAARTWGHVSMWSIYWRLARLSKLNLVQLAITDRRWPGSPIYTYKATSMGVSELGYAMDGVGAVH